MRGARTANYQEEASVVKLGERIKLARQKQNLSLRRLAERVGLTPSLISQIERGQTNPSVASLYAIAQSLGLPMDYFFNSGVDYSATVQRGSAVQSIWEVVPVVRAGQRAVINIAGGVQWSRLTPWHDDRVEFMEIRYEVGASSGDKPYQHRGREYGILLEGRLQVELGGNRYLLEPGDSISFKSDVPHRLASVGDVPAVGIWLILDRY